MDQVLFSGLQEDRDVIGVAQAEVVHIPTRTSWLMWWLHVRPALAIRPKAARVYSYYPPSEVVSPVYFQRQSDAVGSQKLGP